MQVDLITYSRVSSTYLRRQEKNYFLFVRMVCYMVTLIFRQPKNYIMTNILFSCRSHTYRVLVHAYMYGPLPKQKRRCRRYCFLSASFSVGRTAVAVGRLYTALLCSSAKNFHLKKLSHNFFPFREPMILTIHTFITM